MHKAVQQKQGIQRNQMQSHLNLRVELGKSNTNQENHSLLLLSRNNLKSNSIHQQKTFLKRSHVTRHNEYLSRQIKLKWGKAVSHHSILVLKFFSLKYLQIIATRGHSEKQWTSFIIENAANDFSMHLPDLFKKVEEIWEFYPQN